MNRDHLRAFASLHWYDETLKFVFNFVAKTSELLLAAGIIISTANFLTDGGVMSHNKVLSDAWAWAQALAIDSSLGIVFMNAFQAVRERDKIKAVIYFALTALLATVAGLVTHFDALAHAAGLPVTDKGVSGIIPLWIMTTLRALAVISFLLASRLKEVSLSQLRKEWNQESERIQEAQQESTFTAQIDYKMLATTLVETMQQGGFIEGIRVEEQKNTSLPSPSVEITTEEMPQVKLAQAYEALKEERDKEPNCKPISARELAKRANVRRSTCNQWLQQHEPTLSVEDQATQEAVSLDESVPHVQREGILPTQDAQVHQSISE